MGNHHHFLLNVSRLLPSSLSSCLLRTLADAIIAETSTKTEKILHEDDLSPFLKNTAICKETLPLGNSFDAESRKSAAATRILHLNSKKTVMKSNLQGSSLLSLSSNSGDFSGPKTPDGGTKTTDAAGETTAYTEKEGKKSGEGEFTEHEQVSARVYYSNNGGFGGRSRRRRAKSRRKIKKRDWMIEESYAVEKRSDDPRSDFRASMVEMIVERQMLGTQDLERLLICFLSLNQVCNHGIIVDVFSEICETLFGN